MPLKIDLNRPDYWDDYDELKDFYRMLFKSGVSVQMRELNQLQDYFQTQVERFADSTFTPGTIVAGCNFTFHKNYAYVKLPDVELDGTPVVPSNYVGKFIEDPASGLKAYIVNYQDGYELSDPDLKTVYVNYINAGTDTNTYSFVSGNNITVYDGTYPINEVDITAGGAGYSNNDQLIITSSLLVNVTSGTFSAADYLVNQATGANVYIVSANTTAYDGYTLLQIRPRDADQTNASVNSTAWSFSLYDNVVNDGVTATGKIEKIIGQSAKGRIKTNSSGTVTDVIITNGGRNYTDKPTAVVKTSNSSVVVANLILDPKNFLAKMKIPTSSNVVGNGYAFSVSSGTVYQLGHFLRVEEQTVII